MVTTLPRLMIALLAFQTLVAGTLCYELYRKYQLVAACQTRIDTTQRMATQISGLEAQLSQREAALDAAEAQLNGAKQP